MPHHSPADPNPLSELDRNSSWATEPRQALAFFVGTFDNQVSIPKTESLFADGACQPMLTGMLL